MYVYTYVWLFLAGNGVWQHYSCPDRLHSAGCVVCVFPATEYVWRLRAADWHGVLPGGGRGVPDERCPADDWSAADCSAGVGSDASAGRTAAAVILAYTAAGSCLAGHRCVSWLHFYLYLMMGRGRDVKRGQNLEAEVQIFTRPRRGWGQVKAKCLRPTPKFWPWPQGLSISGPRGNYLCR